MENKEEIKIIEEFRNGIWYYYDENHKLLMTSLNQLIGRWQHE